MPFFRCRRFVEGTMDPFAWIRLGWLLMFASAAAIGAPFVALGYTAFYGGTVGVWVLAFLPVALGLAYGASRATRRGLGRLS